MMGMVIMTMVKTKQSMPTTTIKMVIVYKFIDSNEDDDNAKNNDVFYLTFSKKVFMSIHFGISNIPLAEYY